MDITDLQECQRDFNGGGFEILEGEDEYGGKLTEVSVGTKVIHFTFSWMGKKKTEEEWENCPVHRRSVALVSGTKLKNIGGGKVLITIPDGTRYTLLPPGCPKLPPGRIKGFTLQNKSTA